MPGTRPKRILITYSKASTYVPTTMEFLLALKTFTDYEVKFLHVTHDARVGFDLNDFDVIVQNYSARLCFDGFVSEHYQKALMDFRGLKIVIVQDDYDRTKTLHRAVRRLGFHVLMTCIQSEFWPLVYPKSELPGVAIVQGLAGYVPEQVANRRSPSVPLADRRTWVAYRGRDLGARYGRLGFEKYEIGRRMIEICTERRIPHDIAMDEPSRIYGEAWFDFLGSSRAMLGTEGASNVFDFDGLVDDEIDRFVATHGRVPAYPEIKPVLDPLEAPFDVGQITSRIFECARAMTPMILFRGSYASAIEPEEHYIALETDFSNVDSVLERLNDLKYLQGMADRAYRRLVSSGDYDHRALARLLVNTIEREYPLRVDSAWIAYRAQTGRRWMPPKLPADPGEAERIAALTEMATELPLGVDDLADRLTAAKRAGQPTRQGLVEWVDRYPVARWSWMLIPASIRSAALRAVGLAARRH